MVPSRSGVVRPFSERSVLEIFMAKSAALNLSGYIFFGSSVSISEKVSGSEGHLDAVAEDYAECRFQFAQQTTGRFSRVLVEIGVPLAIIRGAHVCFQVHGFRASANGIKALILQVSSFHLANLSSTYGSALK